MEQDEIQHAVAVLTAEMRVVPGRPVLGRSDAIHFARAGHAGTLGDARHDIFGVRVELSVPVPVDARAVVLEVVVHGDVDEVAPVGPRGGGPGYWLLITSICRGMPSGERVALVMYQICRTVRPVVGHFCVGSVLMS